MASGLGRLARLGQSHRDTRRVLLRSPLGSNTRRTMTTTVTQALHSEDSTSAPIRVLLETRVRGVAEKIETRIGSIASVSSTSRWVCWQICDRTVAGRLVGLDYFGASYYSGARAVHKS